MCSIKFEALIFISFSNSLAKTIKDAESVWSMTMNSILNLEKEYVIDNQDVILLF